MKVFIAARLRRKHDQDIIKALEGVDDGDVSDLIRRGLRMVLNKGHTEDPKVSEDVKQPEVNKKPPAKPMVWNFPK